MSEPQIQEITDYIQHAFAGKPVRKSGENATNDTVISVEDQDSTYTLRIDPDFVATYNAGQIRDLLYLWNVAGELRRSEGLPLVLTVSGVRLASSN
jgi:hypothetical protein